MSIPTNESNPYGYDGTPAPPGQAPLAGQYGTAGAPGPGYPATPEQSFPPQTAPAMGAGQPGSPYAPGGAPGAGAGPGSGAYPGPASMPPAPGYGYGYPPPSRPTATSAVAIVAICLFWLPLVGLVLSIVGLVKTGRGKARGRGLAITALVLSLLVTAGAVLVGAEIASKPSALDQGCRIGKTAVIDQSKQMDADSKKGDAAAVRADLATLIGNLSKAANDSHRSDVRSAVLAVHDDYSALADGHPDESKLGTDLDQLDHLCTFGK